MALEEMRQTVLVVDDDCSIRQLVGAILESHGFLVLLAQDGIAALNLAREYPQKIDILLSDVEMPRMDGFTLWRTLAKERPGIGCVIMSGHSNEGEIPVGVAFLAKPFEGEKLVLRVRQSLRKAVTSQPGPALPSSSKADVA